ncbi:MAG: purine-cytosine permease family protein [Cyclobacteriaceae bacterium]
MKQNSVVDKLNSIEEFERTPVPASKQKSLRSFLGMYAGEHTAGTEFVIGPLFVVHGVSAGALIAGLIIGNILAVLSWALICAPIATQTRETLYYRLEKICGRRLVILYNLVNGMMFCFLAGAMIAVSATAVGLPFDIAMPELGDWLPGGISWIITVIAVGSVITLIAMLGYEHVSKFANIAAPWMILVFIAAAFAAMPDLGIHSLDDFWQVANEKIWTGVPAEGQSKFTFWHVMFFAWFCNMAMHIGMADMSILRYARKWQYGYSSAAGVFLGHFVAWIASGILCAAAAGTIAPGPIAYNAAGIAGALCVIIAGWTTANPTIYRAGLAIQGIMPHVKRWKVTLGVGLFTTLAACFPALVMLLLDFVALYGLVLMPMGAVIFVDFYLLPKMGLRQDFAFHEKISFYRAPAFTWFATLFLCLILNMTSGIEIFFLGLPGWFMAAALYLFTSRYLQQKHALQLQKVK